MLNVDSRRAMLISMDLLLITLFEAKGARYIFKRVEGHLIHSQSVNACEKSAIWLSLHHICSSIE